MDRRQKQLACIKILEIIKSLVDMLDDYDVYGDLTENFKELDKTEQIADRLIKMIRKDIRRNYP